jgi:hypothetical protein
MDNIIDLSKYSHRVRLRKMEMGGFEVFMKEMFDIDIKRQDLQDNYYPIKKDDLKRKECI